MTSPKKILAIKLRSLGDTVIMTAALSSLRRSFPQAEIHVAVMSPWASLLEDHSAVNKVWSYERYPDRTSRAKAIARLALRLRKERFDCVVNFHASPSSAMISFATGAKLRSIHFHGHKAKNRYTTVPVPGKGILKPIIERDMDTVRALGLSIPEGRMPSLFVRPTEAQWAREFTGKLGGQKPILALGLGASRRTKSWPMERFATLAIQWCLSQEGAVLGLVSPSEESLRADFLKAVDDALSTVAGSTDAANISSTSSTSSIRHRISVESRLKIRELAAVLGEVTVFAGNDSGPKHIAVAVGTPTVTVFGPEHPFEWHPYPQDQHPYFFVENLACRKDALPGMPPWCALDLCVEEQHKCMQLIGTDAVLAKCLAVAKK